MSLTFKQLRNVLGKNPEAVVALGEDKGGGIKIVMDYGEGTQYSVALSMAKIHAAENPKLLIIKRI